MIGKSTEEILSRAMGFAAKAQHEYFTVEHIFLSLLDFGAVKDVLEICQASIPELRMDLESHLENNVPKARSSSTQPPVATLGVQRLIQRALFQVQSAGNEEIQPLDLFVALFQAKESESLQLLNKYGINRLDVLNVVSHELTDGLPERRGETRLTETRGDAREKAQGSENKEMGAGPGAAPKDSVSDFIINLNERARQGKVDALIGRTQEMDRMVQVLCRRRKNNPLLVGEAGVGKTALAEGLALRIVKGEVPSILKDCVVWSLDIGGLLAGTKFRGDFEGRVRALIQVLQKKPNSILFIDEIHAIVGAGTVSGGSVDGANLLKPLLTQGEVRVMGSTTYKEFRNIFEKDHALVRRFQKIDITEPSRDESVQILKGLQDKFEEHHGVKYTDEALKAAVELSMKHIHDRFLPDKAIDIIDEAGAFLRLAREKNKSEGRPTLESVSDKPGTEKAFKPSLVKESTIEMIVSKIARLPAKAVSISQKERLQKLDENLKMVIFGQDEAVTTVASSIRLARSGLRSGEKPVGSFLFCGPTGVGKTELCKQLAKALGIPFLRFDMSEYMEKHTVSRLIGAPPGYVGFEQEGLLTEAAIKNPHSVILLDEIEKAHPDVWNLLLQVMDYGSLTDNNGRRADFRNMIIVMTSNVGSQELSRVSMGMGGSSAGSIGKPQKAVETAFSPEFRNRLDSIVYFKALEANTVTEVLGKLLVELDAQLVAKGVDLEVSNQAREWLAKKGYDKFLGARPMARLLQDVIKRPLSEEILFGKLENGGSVKITLKDDQLQFAYRSKKRSKKENAGGSSEEGGSSGNAVDDVTEAAIA